ncbi:hypothetical protein [uncultured Methanospirillum sp.]|uniref:hypothetical protein n=1 Tax=uncultured Methanospirillum sp. TaxID=262503 RepID=UPI0029C80EAB|nr:hypothetical protein [uncultured Methanospirillum sp.]
MNPDVADWKVRIEKRVSEKILSYSQPLENGPAANAGVKCYIFLIGNLHHVVLFTIPSLPGEEIVQDIIAHAGSVGASAAVLISPDGYRVLFSEESKADLIWLETLCPLSKAPDGSLLTDQSSIQDPVEIIARYLGELRKELSGWLYSREGETSESSRDLTIQTLMNRVILTKIFHTIETDEPSETTTLMGALCSFVSTVPVLDFYDTRIGPQDEATIKEVRRLAGSPVKELKNIRLSWVRPEDWATAFARYLAVLPKKQHKKRHFQGHEEQEWKGWLLKSDVVKLITDLLAKDDHPDGAFWDPSAGCGELVGLILRCIRLNLIRDERDTITARLIAAGEMVHANDGSPIHIAVVRFVITSWILSGESTHSSLTRTPLWYPILSLNRQIRAGSPLYDERALEEFVSVKEGYPILRRLHPLMGNRTEGMKPFSLIISCPDGKSPGGPPEVACYLTRRFTSYAPGADQGVLFAELAGEFLAPGGKAVIFMRRKWLSESSYRGFRQWITHNSPVTMIVPEDKTGQEDPDNLSALVLHSVPEQTHTVIRFATGEKHSRFRIRKYQIFPASRHKDDGWGLQDPWEKGMMNHLSQGTMTLSEYLFDELYPGTAGDQIRDRADCWTSITWTGSELSVCTGMAPEHGAEVIIPGDDQFLSTLLHSSLVRWYIASSTRGQASPHLMDLIRTLPIRAIDHYSPEETCVSERIRAAGSRLAMLKKRRIVCHAWHDISRIERQITESEKELDQQISTLYGIFPDDCREIRQRIQSDTSLDAKGPRFQI